MDQHNLRIIYHLQDRSMKPWAEVLKSIDKSAKGSVLVSWNVNDMVLRKGEDHAESAGMPPAVSLVTTQLLEIADAKGANGWRIVTRNQEERDRFICAMQILQLYHGLQDQLSGNFITPKKSEAYGQGGLLRWDP